MAVKELCVGTTVRGPDGTDYELGKLPVSTTIFAEVSPIGAESQELYHTRDMRSEETDLRLRNDETLRKVLQHGQNMTSKELLLCVVVCEPCRPVITLLLGQIGTQIGYELFGSPNALPPAFWRRRKVPQGGGAAGTRGTATQCTASGCSEHHRYLDGHCHLHRALAKGEDEQPAPRALVIDLELRAESVELRDRCAALFGRERLLIDDARTGGFSEWPRGFYGGGRGSGREFFEATVWPSILEEVRQLTASAAAGGEELLGIDRKNNAAVEAEIWVVHSLAGDAGCALSSLLLEKLRADTTPWDTSPPAELTMRFFPVVSGALVSDTATAEDPERKCGYLREYLVAPYDAAMALHHLDEAQRELPQPALKSTPTPAAPASTMAAEVQAEDEADSGGWLSPSITLLDQRHLLCTHTLLLSQQQQQRPLTTAAANQATATELQRLAAAVAHREGLDEEEGHSNRRLALLRVSGEPGPSAEKGVGVAGSSTEDVLRAADTEAQTAGGDDDEAASQRSSLQDFLTDLQDRFSELYRPRKYISGYCWNSGMDEMDLTEAECTLTELLVQPPKPTSAPAPAQ
jgi:hypothetical protein